MLKMVPQLQWGVLFFNQKVLDPVIQSIVSLTNSLMTNLLTVVAKAFSNTLTFLLQKREKLLQSKSYTHFFSKKKKHIYAIKLFQDRNFNVTLANNFVYFWTIGLWYFSYFSRKSYNVGTHLKYLTKVLLLIKLNMYFWRKKEDTIWLSSSEAVLLLLVHGELYCTEDNYPF